MLKHQVASRIVCVCGVCVHHIKGDSGGKVNILGGDEEIILYKHVSNSEWNYFINQL